MDEPRSECSNFYVAVVDDDESVCRSFSRLLRIAGFQPITYASAEAFLKDTKRPRFDCLVLDIQLEGISGLELHQRLAAVGVITPVIFITAYDDPKVRAQALGKGCAGYFRKNDEGQMVMEAIRRAIGQVEGKAPTSTPPPAPNHKLKV